MSVKNGHYITEEFTGKKPIGIEIYGVYYTVNNHKEVLGVFLEYCIKNYAEKFKKLPNISGSRYVQNDENLLRRPQKLSNNMQYESNISANDIYRYMRKLLIYFSMSLDKVLIYLKEEKFFLEENKNNKTIIISSYKLKHC